MLTPFTDEQARALVNLDQHYRAWMAAEQALAALPYDMKRKEISGRAYLYETVDRDGNGRSLGPWSDEQAERLTRFKQAKADARARQEGARAALLETANICGALRTPMIANEAGPLLREADRRGMLGGQLIVVGTNAVAAYNLEANGFIREAPDETQDFDLAWAASEEPAREDVLWQMLKAVDPTYTVNMERGFQARNARAYEVEVLVAPSRIGTMYPRDRPRPVPLQEQEWLLRGRPVDHVVICRDRTPARIVAPDPRWFALQKLWMSAQAKRNPQKRGKDAKQGIALLNAVWTAMPQYPLDDAFRAELPEELLPPYEAWKAKRPPRPAPTW
ncbi:GSU2403 family nucleotidyltransferase fold protein [Phenylobacterium sp.]|uniref:GSU2403 family nucleotidyltransferase fold protein n=1 Tax=Phenylobacterium sp. TaxID=1871053 RepID=UPI0035B4CD1A